MVSDDPESFADLDGHIQLASQGLSAESGGINPGTGELTGGLSCESHPESCETAAEQQQAQDKTKKENQNQQAHSSGNQTAGVKAPPTAKPPIAPPPGSGPSGEPNEWVKVPGTDDKEYGPVYKPKYPVPVGPGEAQPRVWWDPHDGHWSHETGKGDRRRHYDRWGTPLNNQTAPSAVATTARFVHEHPITTAVLASTIVVTAALAVAAAGAAGLTLAF
jgi:hypothetical protein